MVSCSSASVATIVELMVVITMLLACYLTLNKSMDSLAVTSRLDSTLPKTLLQNISRLSSRRMLLSDLYASQTMLQVFFSIRLTTK